MSKPWSHLYGCFTGLDGTSLFQDFQALVQFERNQSLWPGPGQAWAQRCRWLSWPIGEGGDSRRGLWLKWGLGLTVGVCQRLRLVRDKPGQAKP